jgi:hypothetical protein
MAAALALIVLCCAGGPVLAAWLVALSAAVAGISGAGGVVVTVLLVGAAGLAIATVAGRARHYMQIERTTVDVELLYTEACPNAAEYLPRLQQLLAAAGVTEPVQVRRIDDPQQAQRERFLGSPTVRINGRDVDPSADQREDYALSCRLYTGPDGLRGTPSDEWVLTLLQPEPGPARRLAAHGSDDAPGAVDASATQQGGHDGADAAR